MHSVSLKFVGFNTLYKKFNGRFFLAQHESVTEEYKASL